MLKQAHHHNHHQHLYSSSSSTSSSIPWLEKLNGVKPLKQLTISTTNGVRGVVAVEDIRPNDIILTVPEDQAIETANNRPPTPFKDFVSQALWEGSKWDQRICYKLLWESDVLGKDSLKYAWLQQIPASYDTPFHWPEKDIKDLQYDSLQKKIEIQKLDWKALYEKWKKDSRIMASKISFDRFVWGLETVNSRAFSGSYEGSSAASRRSVLILTGILTLAYPFLGFGSYEEAIQGAVAVGLSFFLRDYFFSKYVIIFMNNYTNAILL